MSGRDGDGPSVKGASSVFISLCLLVTFGLRYCSNAAQEAGNARGREYLQRMALENVCRGITGKLRMQADSERQYVQGCANACMSQPTPNGVERVICTMEYEARHPPVEDAPVQTAVASRAPPPPAATRPPAVEIPFPSVPGRVSAIARTPVPSWWWSRPASS